MVHPYATTIPGLVSTIRQLRSTFPSTVNADTLRKWSIAPNNEGPILVVLRSLGVIDEDGAKQAEPAKAFLEHDDTEFAAKFDVLVRGAYHDLFELWGEDAWTLERDKLIGFFRTADESSARVGTQQAATFTALAGLAGHGEPPAAAPSPRRKNAGDTSSGRSKKSTSAPAHSGPTPPAPIKVPPQSPTLTVRIEINLPVSDKKEVYDNIFRSIRANLLNEPPAK